MSDAKKPSSSTISYKTNSTSNQNDAMLPTKEFSVGIPFQFEGKEEVFIDAPQFKNQNPIFLNKIIDITGDTVPPLYFIAVQNARNIKQVTKPSSLDQQEIFCTTCDQIILTRIEKRIGQGSYFLGGLLCAFGCCFGCCVVPFCCSYFKNSVHYCPKCHEMLGEVDFMFR